LFNVAIDSKLRGCDLVKLEVSDLVKDGRVRERVSVIQSKTKRTVQFELTENTRETVCAVQLLLGHTKVDSTVRYLGVELEDALSIAERIDI